MMPLLIMASISRKSSNKVPITIVQMLLAGRQTHKNNTFFMGSRGFLWIWIMGSQNVMGLDYGSNISEITESKSRTALCYKRRYLYLIRDHYLISLLRYVLESLPSPNCGR
jgi:hypothetical protein